MYMDNFIECPECDAKTGSPILCRSCLSNRKAIGDRDNEIAKLRKLVAAHTGAIAAVEGICLLVKSK